MSTSRRRASADALRSALAGIAHENVDLGYRHVEFFRDDLRDADFQALAEIDLAEVSRDATVGQNRDPGIEFGRRQRWLGHARAMGGGESHARHRGRDDHRARAQEELAA
jgi:hypothetical protein